MNKSWVLWICIILCLCMGNVHTILTPDTEPERLSDSDKEVLDAKRVEADAQSDRSNDDSEFSSAYEVSDRGFKAVEMDEEEVVEISDTMNAENNIGSEIYDQDTGNKRQNYASLDAGATILDAANDVKSPTNLLVPDKDRYMLFPCEKSARWVLISLSEDVHAEAITIANFEQFSSPVKDFLILGSLNYPTETWYVLGNFTAQQIQGEQDFPLNSKQHVRYIKIRLLNHYGSEYYCTLSQLKIYGKSFSQVISQLEKRIEEDVDLVSRTHASEKDVTESFVNKAGKEEGTEMTQCTLTDKKKEIEATQKESKLSLGNATCAANEGNVPDVWNEETDFESGKSVKLETSSGLAMDQDSTQENVQGSGAIDPSTVSYRKPNTTTLESSASLTAVPTHQGQGFGRLESIFIRITRKLHMLEMNQSVLVRSMEHFQQESVAFSELLQKHEVMFTSSLNELKALIRAMNLKMEQDENRSQIERIESQLAIDDLRNDVASLSSDMMLLREIIITMKAGILCAIVLSVFVIGFFLLRILFRCLQKCKRRADLRDLFRRLDGSDYDADELEYDVASFDTLRDLLFDGRGPRYVNRKQRFGTSWDDLAIERKTLRQKILAEPTLYRFLHTRQASKSSSGITDARIK